MDNNTLRDFGIMTSICTGVVAVTTWVVTRLSAKPNCNEHTMLCATLQRIEIRQQSIEAKQDKILEGHSENRERLIRLETKLGIE